jgi:hypothetical protein
MAGTYEIDCELLNKTKDDYTIKYFDPLINEDVIKTVDEDYIIFEEDTE